MQRQGGKSYRFCSEIEALYVGVFVKNSGIDNGADNGACSDTNIGNEGNVRIFKAVTNGYIEQGK